MNETFRIFAVDDDPVMNALLKAVLEKQYTVEIFGSAEDCLERLGTRTPDMFLLDVSLPGMDGYSLCRHLRENDATRGIPVTFISGHDTEEDRVIGYEAGGDDFVVKPFSTDELLRKVAVAMRLVKERTTLQAHTHEAEKLAGTALSNIGENVILIQLLRDLCRCSKATEVAEAVFEHAFSLGLKSVVQVRVGEFRHTLSVEGIDRPLEVSVMGHVHDMGRIFEFRKRAIFNHEKISVMINDMPFEDASTCEKFRERLALMVEAANLRLTSLEMAMAGQIQKSEIADTLSLIRDALQSMSERQKKTRIDATNTMYQMQENIVRSFGHLGLSGDQEVFINNLVSDGIKSLTSICAEDEHAQTRIKPLFETLQKLLHRN